MRRQYFVRLHLVLASVLTMYGGFSVVSNFARGKEIPLLGIIFLITGLALFALFFVLFIISYFQKKQKQSVPEAVEEEPQEVLPEVKNESIAEELIQEEEPAETKSEEEIISSNSDDEDEEYDYSDEVVYDSVQGYRSYGGDTIYVKKVGHGPILRVSGDQILDMRNNIYYTIEGNIVNKNGYGPVYEINGNRIRLAFGSYLFEISGSNINKTFGGYYASISGNYIQTHDLSEKYECSDSLTKRQLLAVVALLFGSY